MLVVLPTDRPVNQRAQAETNRHLQERVAEHHRRLLAERQGAVDKKPAASNNPKLGQQVDVYV